MKTYTLDSSDWPLILNNEADDVAALFPLPFDSSGDDAAGLERLALARAAAIGPQLVRALEWAAAYVGLYTGNGSTSAGPVPEDIPGGVAGEYDAEAIVRTCAHVLKLARGQT